MSATADQTPKKGGKKWIKIGGITAGGLCVLLVLAYFVGTSGAFIKGVVLTKVGTAIGGKVTADQVALSPFSSLNLSGFKLETTGPEPLVTVKELRVRYSLMSIIGGKIAVDEVTVDSPVIKLVFNADGTSNLPTPPPSSSSSKSSSASSTPPGLAIKNISLKNATVVVTMKAKDGSQAVHEISGLNLTLDQLVNGARSALKLGAALKSAQTGGTNAFTAAGSLNGDIQFELTQALLPKDAKGGIKADLADATGSLAQLKGFQVALDTELSPTELKNVGLTLAKAGTELARVKVSGPFDAAKLEGKLKVELSGIDKRLFGIVGPMVGMDFGDTSITSTTDITLANAGKQIALSGSLTGKAISVQPAGGAATPVLDAAVTYAVQLRDNVLTIEKFSAEPTLGGKSGGTVSASGSVNLVDTTGSVALQLTGLNQDLVKAFAGPKLGGRDLVTISLNGSTKIQLGAGGSIAAQSEFTVNDFVTKAPEATSPDAPLKLSFSADVAKAGDAIDLKSLRLLLPPTARAKNELRVTGKVDLAKPGAISGNLAITSDALDLTDLYAIATGGPATDPNTAPVESASTNSGVAIKLPVGKFDLAVALGHVFLREIDIANLKLNTQIVGSKVTVKPLQLSLNGAPVTASAVLDLGVSGYTYDIAFKADKVPTAPAINSFAPERKGQFDGNILASANLKGAGVSTLDLKKNLSGQLGFSLTNVNIQIVSEKWKPVLTVIGLALRISDIAQSPLNAIYSQVALGNGRIDLKSTVVESEAFRANVTGVINLDDVLTNSLLTGLSPKMELRRSLAKKSNLLPDNTPEDVKYVALPDFIKMKGTIGKPDVSLDAATITMMVLKSTPLGTAANLGGGILKGGAGAVGNVVGGLGGLFGGSKTNTPPAATSRNAPGTTVPATNQPPANPLQNLLNPFLKK